MNLQTPITQLNKVGDVLSSRLKRLGIFCVQDLLYYFPFRYEDFSELAKIADLVEGKQVTVQAKIELIMTRRSPRKRTVLTEAMVSDESGQLRIIWFGQPFIAQNLHVGDEIYFSGKVTRDRLGLQMISPEYEKVKIETAHTARIVPLYPLTEGITHKQMRYWLRQVIHLAETIEDWLPLEILKKASLPGLGKAMRGIHFPENEEDLKISTARLKFDELYILQLRAEMMRQLLARSVAPRIKFVTEPIKKFVADLPFTLTNDQKVAAWEIFKDLERATPMNRLLEGDVGSGKTVVAALAMYLAIENGYQCALMAPTEILATQHYATITKLLDKKITSIGLLTGSTKPKEKITIGARLEAGEISIIIGTHALLSESVQFKNLGLVIVDEQHRFGVDQRRKMRAHNNDDTAPHFLSMTATPIPRSFALTLFGDLDVSIIKQMPVGRKPIKTRVVAPHNREKAYAFIREEIKKGRQCFVICPLIQEDTTSVPTQSKLLRGEQKTVLKEYEHLSKEIFPNLRVGFLHGKMKAKEKNTTMQKFANGETDILVATSVVEVGVNIPNASVMMIEGAERFGLAQLHQFRGRVGRAEHQSYCFLFTDNDTQKVTERLALFEKTLDGFALAEYDLETRGPGEVYGTAQSGMMNLRLATMRDIGLIKLARELARGTNFTKFLQLKEKVKEWEERTHLE
ncbi:MAG: ATP-dependent DNA helicase RecG [Candidatus Magasanikbacteria bacterium RIFCSPHIGHO2_01_FULL_41_23]|nr:MAG: ATP-dependent DNA helicase RecG [Candidatus Magasanikbacteria bacterium RIFCSPHIGHO2_01_FULL_41_23]OGH66867.1 MAG: ATP-dependent DNA helicase RecG [Candidatus Magasanikbacteria bacterium RIFCSPHIGHO2_02_FULL_41_35]OGH74850.1 MAG: ATP-dependent DNA helicase RecG [Candidatus Magasanikbacteria bacterium RIFCSPHIGHO2_12_FULL_41_16]